jgi:hypothetical protein
LSQKPWPLGLADSRLSETRTCLSQSAASFSVHGVPAGRPRRCIRLWAVAVAAGPPSTPLTRSSIADKTRFARPAYKVYRFADDLATMCILMLFLGGIQFIGMGLFGAYVGRDARASSPGDT